MQLEKQTGPAPHLPVRIDWRSQPMPANRTELPAYRRDYRQRPTTPVESPTPLTRLSMPPSIRAECTPPIKTNTMQKEHLIQKLTRYRRTFSQTEQSVSIKSGFGLYVDVIFHENGQVSLRSLFKGYNPLSGFIRLSLKGQVVYTGLLYLAFSVVTGYVMYTTPPLVSYLSILYAFFSVCLIICTVYYLLRAEADKRQITVWLDELPG